MKYGFFVLAVVAALALGACKKHGDEPVAADTADSSTASEAAAAPAQPAVAPSEASEPTEEERARAEQQAKLDYATMEDGYLNDANGHWAASASASSSFGSANEAEPDAHVSNTPWQATGAPNGDTWTNNSQNVGFDWIQLKYANAVKPAEVRAVLNGSNAPPSITRIELIDTTGKSHVIWSGLSDSKRDERGQRTWFVRKVENPGYTTDTVKLTFANNVSSGYKEVDAVQLVAQ